MNGKVKQSLEVKIEDSYDNHSKLVSSVKIVEGKALVSEWKTNDYRATIHQGIEASDKDVFEQIKLKRMIDKTLELFEVEEIIIEPK